MLKGKYEVSILPGYREICFRIIVIFFNKEHSIIKGCATIQFYLFAPVHTILPELNISAVVLGSRILIITAAKR